MTTTQPNAMACPECNADDSVELALGERLCLACRNEWNPLVDAAVRAVTPHIDETAPQADAEIARVLSATTPDEVLSEPLTAAERIAEHTGVELVDDDDDDPLLGTFVRVLDTDEITLVVETVPIGRYVVEWPDGHRRTVPAEMLGPDDLDNVQLDEAHDATPDEGEPIVGVIATIASLCLSIGAEAVAGDEDRTLLNPRIGWLPPPASDIPEVEQGAAYAVAILIHTFNLDGDAVIAIAQSLMAGAAAEAAETREQ